MSYVTLTIPARTATRLLEALEDERTAEGNARAALSFGDEERIAKARYDLEVTRHHVCMVVGISLEDQIRGQL